MDKATIIATIKRQQAELLEMVSIIRKDRRMSKTVKALEKRYKATNRLLEALGEKSYIPKGIEGIDAAEELKELKKEIDMIKSNLKKLQRLEKRKQKIEKKIED
jgi:hypothetical protein